ncbi:hypothetical protein [Natrinema sp. 74]
MWALGEPRAGDHDRFGEFSDRGAVRRLDDVTGDPDSPTVI